MYILTWLCQNSSLIELALVFCEEAIVEVGVLLNPALAFPVIVCSAIPYARTYEDRGIK